MDPYTLLVELVLRAIALLSSTLLSIYCIGIPLRNFYDCSKKPCEPRYTVEVAATVIPRLICGVIILISVSILAASLLNSDLSGHVDIGLLVGITATLVMHLVVLVRKLHRN